MGRSVQVVPTAKGDDYMLAEGKLGKVHISLFCTCRFVPLNVITNRTCNGSSGSMREAMAVELIPPTRPLGAERVFSFIVRKTLLQKMFGLVSYRTGKVRKVYENT